MPFSLEQLADRKTFEDIKSKYNEIVIYDQPTEAYDLAKDLEKSLENIKDFKERYPEFFVVYKKIIHRLKWIGLQVMTESMVAEMFKYQFNEIFNIQGLTVDELWRKLKIILLVILDFNERDEYKKELRNTLLNSQEKLTEKRLIINNQEKSPTVGNWILDYNSNLGAGIADNLKRTQYFINSLNIRNLRAEEKVKAKFLLDFYEKLKYSSNTLEGLEEEIAIDDEGMKGIIKAGVFEPLKEDENKIVARKIQIQPGQLVKRAEVKTGAVETRQDDLKNLASHYLEGSLERKAIEEEINRLTHNT